MDSSSEASTLKWSIPRFSELTERKSQLFNYQPDDKILFVLGLYPLNQLKDDLLVELCCRTRVQYDVPVTIQLSILDSNDQKCYTQDYQWNFTAINGDFLAKFVSREFLINSAERMFPNDVLTLFCKVKMLSDDECLSQSVKRTNEILNDYGSLLKSGVFSDVRLFVGSMEDGEEVKEFAVHKAILSVRSEVFAAMFKHSNTKEAQENYVDIPDVRVQVFEQFLQFIYTSKIDSLNNENAAELFAVSDKYQMNSLKQYCEQYLCSNLAIETLAQTLLLADMHGASKLKSKCLEFFTKNGDQIMKTEGWTKISSKPDLMVDLVQRFVSSQGPRATTTSS